MIDPLSGDGCDGPKPRDRPYPNQADGIDVCDDQIYVGQGSDEASRQQLRREQQTRQKSGSSGESSGTTHPAIGETSSVTKQGVAHAGPEDGGQANARQPPAASDEVSNAEVETPVLESSVAMEPGSGQGCISAEQAATILGTDGGSGLGIEGLVLFDLDRRMESMLQGSEIRQQVVRANEVQRQQPAEQNAIRDVVHETSDGTGTDTRGFVRMVKMVSGLEGAADDAAKDATDGIVKDAPGCSVKDAAVEGTAHGSTGVDGNVDNVDQAGVQQAQGDRRRSDDGEQSGGSLTGCCCLGRCFGCRDR